MPLAKERTIASKKPEDYPEVMPRKDEPGIPSRSIREPSSKLLRPADLPDTFTRSLYKIAPYRGCGHGCRYCDGRAERYYIEGDFEKDIEIRRWIPARLDRELPNLRERGIIGFGSGVTDPYQPLEASEELTGRCARILASSSNVFPAMIMTKSDLPLRDLSYWACVNERAGFILLMSLTSLDEAIREQMEPGASSFASRIRTLEAFKAAGCAIGVIAMPFLPGLTDSNESIDRLFSACKDINVDFIMPGGLTLRPGRQKKFYLDSLSRIDVSLAEMTRTLYFEDRISGVPERNAVLSLSRRIHAIQNDYRIPFLLPHKVYAHMIPSHDAIRILLQDMLELYRTKGISTEPLERSASRYDAWLIRLRRHFRRQRSLPSSWLEKRFSMALQDGELELILDNNKLLGFIRTICFDKARFDYLTLRLENK